MEIDDLDMLKWTLNGFLEAGSAGDVRLRDLQLWLNPVPDDFGSTLAQWQNDGFIEIARPITHCKPKEVCFRLLRPFELAPD